MTKQRLSASRSGTGQRSSLTIPMKLSRRRARAKTLKLPPPMPRNPLVAPSLQRKAGAHRKPHKALRRAMRSRRSEGDE